LDQPHLPPLAGLRALLLLKLTT
jgi:hypothetical protein